MLQDVELASLHHLHLSFQEPLEEEDEDEKGPNPPMMVPVADILNHVANHNANLEYSPVSPLHSKAFGSGATARLALNLQPGQQTSLAWISLTQSCFAQHSPLLHTWL